ncbi:MAG: fibronectin type III domain-containing protein [Deltaproteobacteria bacterium]|nr:fibronectin type III domain-containing protein [Deltaproteobacteria bacterium]
MKKISLISVNLLIFLLPALAGGVEFLSPPIPRAIFSHSVTLEWEASKPALATIEYGATEKMRQHVTVRPFRKFHTVTLTQLKPNTIYYYRVIITDHRGKKGVSPILTFATELDLSAKKNRLLTPPFIKQRSAVSLKIAWETTSDSTALILYDKKRFEVSIPRTKHEAIVGPLVPGTAYSLDVSIFDSSGEKMARRTLSASTLQVAKKERPPLTFKEGPAFIEMTPRKAALEWASEFPTKGIVHFGKTEKMGTIYKIETFQMRHRWRFDKLNPNTIYFYKIVMIDRQRQVHATETLTFATPLTD